MVVAAEGPYGTRSYAAMISCTGLDHVTLAELVRGSRRHWNWESEDEAIGVLQKALRVDPGQPGIAAHLQRAFAGLLRAEFSRTPLHSRISRFSNRAFDKVRS
jgi:hypothetical protein